ncbi:hypothetical protein MKW94_000161 [Papaver nudicaule]|uniref:DNA-directed RNA polymerase subunit n=1 Tax=Papaver nudicaule TaxID=74823 RepID=A0AA41VRC1_PAPNU|nr:hypothetical protein [Papaver nudicaule]
MQLLEDFSNCKVTSDYGYFVAPTALKRIGDGKVRQDSGDVLFPVVFNFITFKPFKGETYVTWYIQDHETGVFLAAIKMEDYHNFPGENPVFHDDKDSKIEKDWIETEREYQILGSLEGDYLGPIYRGES